MVVLTGRVTGFMMSDIVGPEDPQRLMWEMSLGEFLEAVVNRNPDKVFVEMSGRELTYRQFHREVEQAASMFQNLGVAKGDRVCLFMPNCPEYLFCWFGLSSLGAISVPINTAYKRDETAYILNNAEATAIVAHESLLAVAQEAAALAPKVRHRLVVEVQQPNNVEPNPPTPPFGEGGKEGISESWIPFSAAMLKAETSASPSQVSPQDISMLVYTSGTTGNPKGVMVTHQMYVAAGQGFAHWTQATPQDRFFTCLPYFHANVQYYSTMG